MANGIDKKALFKLKSEPYLKPISDLGVGFYNLDENTAILQFQVSNSKGPLLIHDNNLKAYAYFESSNGSASNVLDLDIIDSNNGILQLTIDKDFLQASTSTKVKGQLYISVNNVDGKPEYNEVAVLREFTFEVKDALINKISATTKIEYIRMFDRLKVEIEKRIYDIEQAIANGEDYVAEMKTVLQQGKDALNKLVADGTKEVNDTVTQAKSDVETSKTNAVNTMTQAKDTMLQAIEDEEIVNSTQLDSKLDGLSWQKHKITEDRGHCIQLDNVDFDKIDETLKPGLYWIAGGTNRPVLSNGYLTVKQGTGLNSYIKVVFEPFATNEFYVRTKNATEGWSEWEKLLTTESDLPGQQYILTNDDGTVQDLADADLKNVEFLDTIKPGSYYTPGPTSSPNGASGFLTVTQRSSIKIAYFYPHNQDKVFINRYYQSWSGWKELTVDTEELNWQKYKLTENDGTYKEVSIQNDLEKYRALPAGFYYTTTTPITGVSSTAGFTVVEKRSNTVTHIRFRPCNSEEEYLMRYFETWGDWEDITPGIRSKVLFDGSTNGVGKSIGLTDDIYNYKALVITGSSPGGAFNQLVLTSTIGDYFFFREANLADSDGRFTGIYEAKIDIIDGATLKIANDVSWDEKSATGSGPERNAFSVLHIEGWK